MKKEKTLFTANELMLMGFRLVKDGGYTYYALDTNKDDLLAAALFTNDMMKAVKSPVYHVYENGGSDQDRLTKSDIRIFKIVHAI